jgi:hypothetical protein
VAVTAGVLLGSLRTRGALVSCLLRSRFRAPSCRNTDRAVLHFAGVSEDVTGIFVVVRGWPFLGNFSHPTLVLYAAFGQTNSEPVLHFAGVSEDVTGIFVVVRGWPFLGNFSHPTLVLYAAFGQTKSESVLHTADIESVDLHQQVTH